MKINQRLYILSISFAVCIILFITAFPALAPAESVRFKVVTSAGDTKEIELYNGYYALVIGCDDYKSGWQRLSNRANGAREISKALKSMGWTVKTVENPDGQALKRAVQRLVFNEGKDTEKAILIWFSGHGYTIEEADGTGLGYIVPVDAPDPGIDPVGFTEKALSLRDVETVFRQIRSKHVLMVLDANISGDVFRMIKAKPLPHLPETVTKPARQLIIAGSEKEKTLKESTLTKVFIRGIKEAFADSNKDGYITGEEIALYLSTNTIQTSTGDKKPTYGKINNPRLDKGNFVMAVMSDAADKSRRRDVSKQKQETLISKKKITNKLGMTFVSIPPGTFMMGSPPDEPGRDNDESRHSVTLSQGFYMQTTEVTQRQWKQIMGFNPSKFINCGDECPVERVSWEEVQVFIQRLNKTGGGIRYRLPTEAEWEYASRAGSSKAIYTGNMPILGKRNAPALSTIAWYGGNSCVDYSNGQDCSRWKGKEYDCSSCGPNAVGLKKPNAWGLYDMLGNVYEWCQDFYGKYPSVAVTDPTGPLSGTRRLARGGAWDHHAGSCRSANRSHFFPTRKINYLGFRLVLVP